MGRDRESRLSGRKVEDKQGRRNINGSEEDELAIGVGDADGFCS